MITLLGLDIGTSRIKAALVEAESGRCLAHSTSPAAEMEIQSPFPGWAEQDPESWWEHVQHAVRELQQRHPEAFRGVVAMGIAYQMHGLVLLGGDSRPVRPAILWCDSRAVEMGGILAGLLGPEGCRTRLLNPPGNFTASKLAWVKAHEPWHYRRAAYAMLPGDYVALRLTGRASTTACGLSEGTLWDFQGRCLASFFLDRANLSSALLPPLVPTFGQQGVLCGEAAQALGLKAGLPLTYRAGDQLNNAWSLGVLQPGEIAATAGTSGVIFGVTDRAVADPAGRINTFLHLSDTPEAPRLGLLLCLNGCGILQAWARRILGLPDYESLNALAAQAPLGARGLRIYPFGNGAERMLGNQDPGASFQGLDFRRHGPAEIARAVQEGIAFALRYGLEAMGKAGLRPGRIRAGRANLFLSPIFRQSLSSLAGVPVELLETDGAVGAALGAGYGAGLFLTHEDAVAGLRTTEVTEPACRDSFEAAYQPWKRGLASLLTEGAHP